MLLLVIVGKEAECWELVGIINKSITDAGPKMTWHLCYATEFYEWIINFSKWMLILIRSTVFMVSGPCHRFQPSVLNDYIGLWRHFLDRGTKIINHAFERQELPKTLYSSPAQELK